MFDDWRATGHESWQKSDKLRPAPSRQCSAPAARCPEKPQNMGKNDRQAGWMKPLFMGWSSKPTQVSINMIQKGCFALNCLVPPAILYRIGSGIHSNPQNVETFETGKYAGNIKVPKRGALSFWGLLCAKRWDYQSTNMGTFVGSCFGLCKQQKKDCLRFNEDCMAYHEQLCIRWYVCWSQKKQEKPYNIPMSNRRIGKNLRKLWGWTVELPKFETCPHRWSITRSWKPHGEAPSASPAPCACPGYVAPAKAVKENDLFIVLEWRLIHLQIVAGLIPTSSI